jgi:hypothetical protein
LSWTRWIVRLILGALTRNRLSADTNVRYGSLADIVQRPRNVCFTPKADIRQRALHVRYVPIADMLGDK